MLKTKNNIPTILFALLAIALFTIETVSSDEFGYFSSYLQILFFVYSGYILITYIKVLFSTEIEPSKVTYNYKSAFVWITLFFSLVYFLMTMNYVLFPYALVFVFGGMIMDQMFNK
ncbi:hypothetical protein DEFR109230_19070 [Deinococcus frigens]